MKKLIKLKHCPICKNRSKKIYQLYTYEKTINKKVLLKINQCLSKNCSHIFLSEYNKNDLKNHYQYPRYETKITKADIKYSKERVNFIENNTRPKETKSVLEIGPGEGFFLKYLNTRHKYFYDINANVINKLKEKYHFFDLKKKNKKFDLICACHMLEHVPEPYIFLKDLKNILSSDGKIFIEVPDYSYFSDPENVEGIIYEHLHYFSLKSFQNLLDRHNLEIISIKRNLNKNNITCINYALQILITFKTSKKNNVIEVLQSKYDHESKIIKKNIRNKKKILFWGIGTNFFKLATRSNLKTQQNISFTDIREHGKNIFDLNIQEPKKFYKKKFDLIVISTSDVTNVKESLLNLKIKFDQLLSIKY